MEAQETVEAREDKMVAVAEEGEEGPAAGAETAVMARTARTNGAKEGRVSYTLYRHTYTVLR